MNAKRINELFREKGRTLCSAESFTGGNFAGEITKVPGASHFFKGAFVTYFTEAKVRLLGIPYEELDKYGVVSAETAMQMASRARLILKTDYAVSFTGNAGPDTMENKPAGEVYVGISSYRKTQTYKLNLSGSREEVVRQAMDFAFRMLEQAILENN